MSDARFSIDEAEAAFAEWRFNCGPAALAAVLGLTPAELRPHLLDFERKGYTNPTLMAAVLQNLRVPFRRIYECPVAPRSEQPAVLPTFGLVRVQWAGPWTASGVPMAARYRHTHWVGTRGVAASREAFDVNAMCVGGWIPWGEWAHHLVPWLLRETEPKASGEWWPTHCWQLAAAQAVLPLGPAPAPARQLALEEEG